jgi:hypothetical protein
MAHRQISILTSSFSLADKAFPFDILHRYPGSQSGGELDLGAICQ